MRRRRFSARFWPYFGRQAVAQTGKAARLFAQGAGPAIFRPAINRYSATPKREGYWPILAPAVLANYRPIIGRISANICGAQLATHFNFCMGPFFGLPVARCRPYVQQFDQMRPFLHKLIAVYEPFDLRKLSIFHGGLS